MEYLELHLGAATWIAFVATFFFFGLIFYLTFSEPRYIFSKREENYYFYRTIVVAGIHLVCLVTAVVFSVWWLMRAIDTGISLVAPGIAAGFVLCMLCFFIFVWFNFVRIARKTLAEKD